MASALPAATATPTPAVPADSKRATTTERAVANSATKVDGTAISFAAAMFAGLWAAFAVTNELPACVFGLAMFVAVAWRSRRLAIAFVIGAAVPLVGFFVTTYLSTGSWLPFYSKFGTAAYRYEVDGVPSYWMNPSGIDANQETWWVYLLHCTVGHHGLLSLTPVFVLSLAGWCVSWRRSHSTGGVSRCVDQQTATDGPRMDADRFWKWYSLFAAGMTGWVLVFYLRQTQSYNYGGNSAGPLGFLAHPDPVGVDDPGSRPLAVLSMGQVCRERNAVLVGDVHRVAASQPVDADVDSEVDGGLGLGRLRHADRSIAASAADVDRRVAGTFRQFASVRRVHPTRSAWR
jgi:hypothetical protein